MVIPQAGQAKPPDLPVGIVERIKGLGDQIETLSARQEDLAKLAGLGGDPVMSRLEIFHGYIGVFVAAFIISLLATPLMRRLALANGIIDRPSGSRKLHRLPIAYLGGVAVFLGLMAGVLYSYFGTALEGLIGFHHTRYLVAGEEHATVPLSILLGLTVIMLVGLLDDVVGLPPWQKVGGMLFAAAALAADDVGVKVASGALSPTIGELVGNADLKYFITLPFTLPTLQTNRVEIDLIYWTGTVIIALFVLGACNASNLIDGLDGLATGTTAIASGGLLVVALTMAMLDDGPRDAQRIVLCLALLGACLGFLPHNFNPATIFLGDCGSLLLGFTTIVIVLTLGDTGKTHLVFAGLIIYAIPIIDTVLAIIRRRLAGASIADADDQHLHHMIERILGVKGAVLSLYGIGIGFGVLGVLISMGRARVVYAIVLVIASMIVVAAVKSARRRQIEAAASLSDQPPARRTQRRARPEQPRPPAPVGAGAGAGVGDGEKLTPAG